jgi:hypothetical protein
LAAIGPILKDMKYGSSSDLQRSKPGNAHFCTCRTSAHEMPKTGTVVTLLSSPA